MARQLPTAANEVRVVFSAAEAEGFRRGGALLPDGGRDERIASAVRRTLQALSLEFGPLGECVEVRVTPLVEVALGPGAEHAWYAVDFAFAGGSPEERRVLAGWLADHAPRLRFAIAEADAPPARDARAPVPA